MNWCPDCEYPTYDSGCAVPGHPGVGCQSCGWGCDLDLVPDEDSRCVAAAVRATTDNEEAGDG